MKYVYIMQGQIVFIAMISNIQSQTWKKVHIRQKHAQMSLFNSFAYN